MQGVKEEKSNRKNNWKANYPDSLKKDYVPFEESNVKFYRKGISAKIPPDIKWAQKKHIAERFLGLKVICFYLNFYFINNRKLIRNIFFPFAIFKNFQITPLRLADITSLYSYR